MRLLIDTHAMLWVLQGSSKLTENAADAFRDMNNEVFFSAVSYWEICLKISLEKLKLRDSWQADLDRVFERNTILWLPIKKKHLRGIIDLPWIHRDPFDRLLIAQAMAEELVFITADENIKNYGVQVVW